MQSLPNAIYLKIRPFFFKLDPETAHQFLLEIAQSFQTNPLFASVVSQAFAFDDPRLQVDLWGCQFKSPLGLAAGFDKNAQIMPFLGLMGFSFVEVGSVSAQPWPGNPKPRVFRLIEDEAIINRMGLNNWGIDAVIKQMPRSGLPLGFNITKTPDPNMDFEAALADFGYSYQKAITRANYVTINISCPNTQEGKTFEDPKTLASLLSHLCLNKKNPVLIKFSPPTTGRPADDHYLREMIGVCLDNQVAGFVISNTTTNRENLNSSAHKIEQIGRGGLSGRPLAHTSNMLLRAVFRITEGKVPLIGVGGVWDANSAYEKIKFGASLIQIFTGLVYQGPGITKQIKEGLINHLKTDGIDLKSAIGRNC